MVQVCVSLTGTCDLSFQCESFTACVLPFELNSDPFYLRWKDTVKKNLPHPQRLSRYLVGRRMVSNLRLKAEMKTTALNHYQKK